MDKLIHAKDDDRLRGWKEIAAALHASERTAQRWEEAMALPVHRVPGARGDQVFAYQRELDAWMTAQEDHQPEVISVVQRDNGIESLDAAPVPARARSRTRWLLAAIVALSLVTLAAVALSIQGQTQDAASGGGAPVRGTSVQNNSRAVPDEQRRPQPVLLRVSVDGGAAVVIGVAEGDLGRIAVPGKGLTLGVMPRLASDTLSVRLFRLQGATVTGEPVLTELASLNLVRGTPGRCEVASVTVVLEWTTASGSGAKNGAGG